MHISPDVVIPCGWASGAADVRKPVEQWETIALRAPKGQKEGAHGFGSERPKRLLQKGSAVQGILFKEGTKGIFLAEIIHNPKTWDSRKGAGDLRPRLKDGTEDARF